MFSQDTDFMGKLGNTLTQLIMLQFIMEEVIGRFGIFQKMKHCKKLECIFINLAGVGSVVCHELIGLLNIQIGGKYKKKHHLLPFCCRGYPSYD